MFNNLAFGIEFGLICCLASFCLPTVIYVILAESVPILATPTHLLDEFSSCMYNRFCNGKLVELRLKLILFLEYQNQIWFQIGSTNLLFMELLAAGSLPMNQWCQIGPSNLLFITKISRALACENSNFFIRGDFSLKVP